MKITKDTSLHFHFYSSYHWEDPGLGALWQEGGQSSHVFPTPNPSVTQIVRESRGTEGQCVNNSMVGKQ